MAEQIKSSAMLHAPQIRTHHDKNEKPIDLSKRCNSISSNEARSPNSSFNSGDSPVGMMNEANLINEVPIAHPIAKRPWESNMQTFDIYSKHPMAMGSPNDANIEYSAFSDKMFTRIYGPNGGPIATNSNISQSQDNMGPTDELASPQPVAIVGDIHGQEQVRDSGYLERRRKNNEAAKRSRDRRRQKGETTAVRAKLLELENTKLNIKIDECNQLLAYLSQF